MHDTKFIAFKSLTTLARIARTGEGKKGTRRFKTISKGFLVFLCATLCPFVVKNLIFEFLLFILQDMHQTRNKAFP
jgi:hypothetical protein